MSRGTSLLQTGRRSVRRCPVLAGAGVGHIFRKHHERVGVVQQAVCFFVFSVGAVHVRHFFPDVIYVGLVVLLANGNFPQPRQIYEA